MGGRLGLAAFAKARIGRRTKECHPRGESVCVCDLQYKKNPGAFKHVAISWERPTMVHGFGRAQLESVEDTGRF